VLVLTSRSKQRVVELAGEIGARNTDISVVPVELDLTRPCKDQFEQDVFSHPATHGAFKRAIIIHNAARMGDMGKRVSEWMVAKELQEQLNVNVVSCFILNSLFLAKYKAAQMKFCVDLGPSAVRGVSSFGMVTLVKPARKHTFDVLAAEDKDVKVLHYDPVLVESDSLATIRDTTHCEHVRKMSTEWFDRTLTKEKVAETLGKLLWENTFESGETWNAMGERAANLSELTKTAHH